MIRMRAKNQPGTLEYDDEPYTVQHFFDWLWQMVTTIPLFVWFVFRHFTSKTFRVENARRYNQVMFGNIPTSQIVVFDEKTGRSRPLREDERTWPE